MEHSFWTDKWKNKQIGFHLNDVNPFLVNHLERLELHEGSTIFIPLCGKTLDIKWLLDRGFNVIGSELSEIAIVDFFEELGVTPTIETIQNSIKYSSENLTIYVGDIFKLDETTIGKVDAVYDRAALVALPKDMRIAYADHLKNLTQCSKQLLITIQYNEQELNGPPFNITELEVNELYPSFIKTKVIQLPMDGGLKNHEAFETVWILKPAKTSADLI